MTHDATLREARAAFAHREWEAARAGFRARDDLSADDLTALATACWWLGLAEEHLRVNEEVHRHHLREGAVARAALAALEIGFCELLRGHGDAGAGWLARARRLLEEVPDAPERGYLLALDAEAALGAGDVAAAEALAGQVLELGDRHEDPTLQAQGLFLTGVLALRRGRPAEAGRWLDEAMLPVQSGRVVPEWAGNLYCRMIQLCHELGDLPRAQQWTIATERWCRGFAPAVMFTGVCRVHRVQLMQVQGDWAVAEQEAEKAVTELAGLDVLVVAEAHYRLGELHRLRGDLDAAGAAYRRAHENGRDPLPGLALLHLCRGRGRVAASVLDAALAAESTPLRRAPLLTARVEVALVEDKTDRAAACLDELAGIAEEHASPGWRTEERRWRGALLVARGRPAEAAPVLREARAQWQRMGAPYEVARVRLDLAAACDALGDSDTAERERDEAALLLDRVGADRDLAILRAHRGDRRTPGGVSRRELEVLEAVAAGRTNREIAKRLHISERTVARHLANLYLKTGVASRTAAVTWAREHGLL